MLRSADPRAAFLANEAAVRDAIDRVLSSGRYILGAEVEAFEEEFAHYLGGGFTVGVGNGTDAIELALRAAGVRPGDLVATVANTVSATAAGVGQLGAQPVFVEIDESTMLMSPDALDECLGRHGGRVRAVVPVHLYGNPADMPALLEVAGSHGARVVEDCAQAHGAAIEGRKAGTFGDLAAFSFYPTKNLGALGDGGAVFTRDSGLAEQVRLLRQYGWRTRYVSEIPGRNSRLDEMQAAILRARLERLDEDNAVRGVLAARYLEQLASSSLHLPGVRDGAAPVWHQFAVRAAARDRLREALYADGIECAVLYPVPLHHQPAWLDPDTSLPITEKTCSAVLCLPCHGGITPADADRVCDALMRHIQ